MNNFCKYICIGFILEQFFFEEKYVAILIIIVYGYIITWKDCNMKGQKYHSGKTENRERERIRVWKSHHLLICEELSLSLNLSEVAAKHKVQWVMIHSG